MTDFHDELSGYDRWLWETEAAESDGLPNYDEDDWYEDIPEPIEDDGEYPSGAYVSVWGYGGVAWYVRHVLDGQVICRMVGDDRDFSVGRDELSSLAREDFCGECGQVGCTHDGYEREAS
jgi:hypothetical protein